VVQFQIADLIERGIAAHRGQHMRGRNIGDRAKTGEGFKEFGMARFVIATHARLPPTGRKTVDQLGIAGRFLTIHIVDPPFRRTGARCGTFHAQTIGGHAKPRLLRPAQIVLGPNRTRQVVMQIAALGHGAQEHAQIGGVLCGIGHHAATAASRIGEGTARATVVALLAIAA
jgi:hypothetical protein